jgi:bromodomain and WD repeat domain-containing protein 1/3
LSLGDSFRCFIDDTWWPGTIIKRESFDLRHENSPFQCFIIRWDNGESEERLSPWDIFECDDSRINSEFHFILKIYYFISARSSDDPAPTKAPSYQPTTDEWPPHGADVERERLLKGIDTLMQIDVAELFRSPGKYYKRSFYKLISFSSSTRLVSGCHCISN